jgi:UPF0755 protein
MQIESNQTDSETVSSKSRWQWFVFFGATIPIFVLASTFLWYGYSKQPPVNFPTNTPLVIKPGTTASQVAKDLAEAQVVKSDFLLYLIFIAFYDPTSIKASTYVFSEPLDVWAVAERLTSGDFLSNLISFTHREGMSNSSLATDVSRVFSHISREEFLEAANGKEGRLFPETYFVPPDITAVELVRLMEDMHERVLIQLEPSQAIHELSLDEIVILASILEREANSPDSMQVVANILLRRLSIDMPLQVDASMEYVLDKPLSELTPEDLKADSPYNTYLYRGLTPTPIGNPGATALEAVIKATTTTPYLFYITGNDGVFYYGRDFDEHRLNIDRYLR